MWLAGIAADVILLVHLGFIVFAAMGGLLILRWPRLLWLHLPCVLWGAMVEVTGWICPLTPLENHLRQISGQPGYGGGCIDHYLVPLIYPPGLTRAMQIGLGIVLLLLNIAIYVFLWHRQKPAATR